MLLYVVLAFVYFTNDVLYVLVRCGCKETKSSGVYSQYGYSLTAYATCCAQQCSVATEANGNVGGKIIVVYQLFGFGNCKVVLLDKVVERLVYSKIIAIFYYGIE